MKHRLHGSTQIASNTRHSKALTRLNGTPYLHLQKSASEALLSGSENAAAPVLAAGGIRLSETAYAKSRSDSML
ncbi:MAG: hypothetical protein GX824_09650 [Clostridiales bacterium]|jgi:hypothetical protein|nr:hypothetical protein [Clostridiales bacterium]